MSPHFSIDLAAEAKKHLSFLKAAHQIGISLGPITKRSLERYVNLWLPLVAAHPDVPLVPPLDIAWIWHCHRLAPLRYESFCLQRFGIVVEPLPAFVFQTKEQNSNDQTTTTVLWAKMYPDEPLFLLTTGYGSKGGADVNNCNLSEAATMKDVDQFLDGFNILASASAQAGFLWQVSGPMFQVDDFIAQGVENYYKFLTLSPGDLPLVPTYQIDLIWHTHMLASVTKYNHDCLLIRGSKFNHDDSLNDRTAGSKLDLSFQDTCQRWYAAYGEPYHVEGGMYRGEPDAAYYRHHAMWTPEMSMMIGSAGASWLKPATAHPTDTNTSAPMAATGATSTGTNNDASALSPWIVPNEQNNTFIKARKRTKQTNANPQIPGYVFGRGCKGDGYYSFETKDAYEIVKRRLTKIYQLEHSRYHNYEMQHCLCLGCSQLTAGQMQEKNEHKIKMEETGELLAIIKTRLSMPGPHTKITLEDAKRNGAKGNNDDLLSGGSPNAQQRGDDVQYYNATTFVFWTGAGCGGGGGAGGAACGAACGGGGGGCGGGGCGGGGCGGGGGGG